MPRIDELSATPFDERMTPRALALPFLPALLAFASCASARSTPAAVGDVRAVLDAQQRAWNEGDVERFLRAGYWDSPELTFYSGGDVVRGFETMLRRFLERYKASGKETGSLTFADVDVLPLGDDHALARGHWFVDFASQPDQGGLFSLVLERKSEGWRIVHDHTSVAASGERKVQ